MKSSNLEEVVTKGVNCLIAKLFTSRPFNREAFKATMRKAWSPTKLTKFHELCEGMTMIEFENKLAKERVLRDSP